MVVREERLLRYAPQMWKKNSALTLGVNNVYGPEKIFDVEPYFTEIILQGVRISVGGTFETGETVTTKITLYFYDGSSNYVEKSATAVGDIVLSETDLYNLFKDDQRPYRIGLAAKSNLSSTTVTISVYLRGFEI